MQSLTIWQQLCMHLAYCPNAWQRMMTATRIRHPYPYSTLTVWNRLVVTMRIHVGYSSALLKAHPELKKDTSDTLQDGYGDYWATLMAARSHFKAPWNRVDTHWVDQLFLRDR